MSDSEAVFFWLVPLNAEFGKSVRAGFSVCITKVQLRFMIILVLKGVAKPHLAACVLFITVVFVACGLLLATCCPRDPSDRGQEQRGYYTQRASSEVLGIHQML